MKRFAFILLSITSIISFLCAALMSGIYYLGYLGFYKFYTADTVIASVVWAVVLIAVLILFVLLLRFSRKAERKTVPAVLLVISIFTFLCLAFYFFICNFFGFNGYDYTEDISDYGEKGVNIKYFPEEITTDMDVVDYSYYYRYSDTDHSDIYLEVRFDNREVMDEHLSRAVSRFGENGVHEYQNPYNSKYTDIVENRERLHILGSGEMYSAYIDFEGDEDYKYVNSGYYAISYSYDDLTIIYIYLDIGSDISIKEYYPKYLRRFGVEWNLDNDFYVPYKES